MEEIWKDIEDYEGIYQVSNEGRIKSFKRRGSWEDKIRKITKVGKNWIGHAGINLKKNGKEKRCIVSRLVAQAFKGFDINSGLYVLHKDETLDKDGFLDNSVGNLWLGTHQDNMDDMVKKGRNNGGITQRKKVNQYELDGTFIQTRDSIAEVFREKRISNISAACRGKVKTAGGYKWKYLTT